MRTSRSTLLFAFALLFMAASLIAHAQTALQFVSLPAPCRLIDTRQTGGARFREEPSEISPYCKRGAATSPLRPQRIPSTSQSFLQDLCGS